MDTLLSAPVLVKVLGSLAVMLAANLLGVPFIVAVLAGTLALAVWAGFGPGAMAAILWERLIAADTLMLTVVIFQVIWLSAQMEQAGVMRDLVATLRARFSHRASIAMLPAVIGLLPMPGGAVFSAPLVDQCDTDRALAPGLKTLINYWFRHIWEYWWPLYPGVLLAMHFTGLEVWQVLIYGAPLTLVSVAAGYAFLLRRVHVPDGHDAVEGAVSLAGLLRPIVVIIIAYAAVRLGYAGAAHLWPGLPPINTFVPMAVGVLCASLTLQRQRPLARDAWRRILLSPKAAAMAGIVLALQGYGAFIQADLPGGRPMMAVMNAELTAWGIPLWAILALLPFVSGLTMGVAFGFVGASFPIVISLLGPAPAPGVLLATAALAYGCGYLGMMLSPVHVCLVVTNEHFSTRLHRTLPGLLAPSTAIAATVAVLYVGLRWLAR